MTEVVETAPAKINLALHVTGQREDGYHLLDSLVTFATSGDRLTARPDSEDSFSISGPFADGLETDGGNLVLRARDLLRAALAAVGIAAPPVALHLEKNLPIASGIGGGSADAAATLRALSRLWSAPLDTAALASLALRLGADVPMCLSGRPAMARGIGEDLTPASSLPELHLLLVNPLKPVSTPDCFRRLDDRNNPPLAALPTGVDLPSWVSFLADQRNDLQAPAQALVPDISRILTLLRLTGARLARMSGSGATCFGLFETAEQARAAGESIAAAQPGWFVMPTTTISGTAPQARALVPLDIAVLTISDTRTRADDRSGDTLAARIEAAGHRLAERAIVPDDKDAIRAIVMGWIETRRADVIITTGGTGFTGRDVTPEALEPLFDKRMDGFSQVFHRISYEKIGTSTIQSRATAGLIGTCFVFCLPGSPGACKDGWDGILKDQLDYRHRPCNFVEIMPRLDEHLRRKP